MTLSNIFSPQARRQRKASETAVRFCQSGVNFGDPLKPDWGTSLNEIKSDIIDGNIDLNYLDKNGYSMMHFLGRCLYKPKVLEFAEFLIDHGASLELVDDRGTTPLLLHAARCHAVKLFVDNGANIYAVDNNGDGVFHKIVRNFTVGRSEDNVFEAVQILRLKGADPELKNKKGYRPLDNDWELRNAVDRDEKPTIRMWSAMIAAMGNPGGTASELLAYYNSKNG